MIARKLPVTQVQFGTKSFQGVLISNNPLTFGIGVPQLVDIFPWTFSTKIQRKNGDFRASKRVASRNLKRLLGEDFRASKYSTEIDNAPVNVIKLIDMERLLLKMAVKGDPEAIQWTEELIGLSLHQLFCDAFKIKFEAEDRQEFLTQRQQGILARREYTDVIKAYLDAHPEVQGKKQQFMYSTVSDLVNRDVLGKTAKALREERGLATDDQVRDSYDAKTLGEIRQRERHAAMLVEKQDMCPISAIKEAIRFYS
ncbi:MAG: hypothetical protein F6K53_20235 [Moorea sp. SIO4A1]|uniref:hypothetical protein n=1 Tax=Moorena sp. SIO4A1 TaxID=2607835 RepID=UPI00144F9F90|nr:hypothetical protein [Moorena sp. SIO4A1]NEQ59601.1 hypothetical protein [Moorena sp. SIO4A1]